MSAKSERALQGRMVGVDMKNYMDGSYIVVNNTIIAYNGQHSVIKIPIRFADMEISRIGDGSFMELSRLCSVTLPPQIKAIGCQAFWQCSGLMEAFIPGGISYVGLNAFGNCPNLEEITIYGLELTPSEYHMFKTMGKRSHEGIYVLREMPQSPLVQMLAASINHAKPATNMPDDLPLLFQMSDLDERRKQLSLDRNISVIGFDVPSVPTTENSAFFAHIKNAASENYARKADQQNDYYVRVGSVPSKEKTIIFTFDDAKTKEKNGKYLIHATLKIGYFFWQSAQPIICEKKQYYIYRRYYLSADSELEYVRRDMAVYSKNGLVTDRAEAQNVYAKYKLLSIL